MTKISINISTEGDIVAARQKGRSLAKELGFSVVDQCRIATGISELARNIFLYASIGIVSIRTITNKNRDGLEIIAKDDGPGISDTKLAMLDGYSTSNGLGMGLPGCQRLMDEFEISSELGIGTKIVIRKWLG
jgi:serine/threonine-protein kinase RsbT